LDLRTWLIGVSPTSPRFPALKGSVGRLRATVVREKNHHCAPIGTLMFRRNTMLLRNTCSCGTPVPHDPLLAARAITCEIVAPGNLAGAPSVQISATHAYERCAMLRSSEIAASNSDGSERSLRSITTHLMHNTAHSAMYRSNSDRSSAILRWIAPRFVASWLHAGSRNMETVT